ncbi:MAG: ABC transporter ATP-binding protein [Mesorhizobium sp.]
MLEPVCEIQNVAKNYGSYRAVHPIDLSVQRGEFIALVGPSGCGKTSLLKVIAGFEQPTEGRLLIGGKDMTGVSAARRPTSMVFQKLALFPHKTVADNIGFPLKIAKVPKPEIEARTREILTLLELKPEYLKRYPAQLSGGEQQRVALGRSMISQPELLLLDEPLSALDVKLKKVLQTELKRLHRNIGVTFIHVTHDLEEAMMLADRICVMRAGRVLQVGVPDDIYYRPQHSFVASFVGDTNLFEIEVTGSGAGGRYRATFAHGLEGPLPPHQRDGTLKSGRALLMVRPEFLKLERHLGKDDPRIRGTVVETFMRGSTTQVKIGSDMSQTPVTAEFSGKPEASLNVGEPIVIGWKAADAHIIPGDADVKS